MEKKNLIREAVVVSLVVVPFCVIPLIFPGLATLLGVILILLPILALTGKLKRSAVNLLTPGRRPGTGLRMLEILVGIVLIVAAGTASTIKAQHKLAADQQAQAETEKRVHEARVLSLKKNMSTVVLTCRARIDVAKAALEKSNYAQAEENLAQVSGWIDPYLRLLPVPPEIASVRQIYERLAAEVAPITKAQAAWKKAQEAITDGDGSLKARKFVEAQTFFVTAQDLLKGIGDPSAKTLGLDLSHTASAVESKLKLLKRPAAREEAALQKARIEREAVAYACGEKPERSAWDGAIIGLESALKENAHDPRSIDVSACSEPVMSDKRCWIFRCKVRGKNAFGALILKTPMYEKNRFGFSEIN